MGHRSFKFPVHLLMLACVCMLAACASAPKEGSYDPNEYLNRKISSFNDTADNYVLKPASDAYTTVTPSVMRQSISNFFDNALYMNTVLNDFLQGKGTQGFSDLGRFLVNSTLGILGFFDPAEMMGMKKHQEDFGQTLGVWGVPQGAYLVYPLLGPNTARDTPDIVVSTLTSAIFYAGFYLNAYITIPVAVLSAIDLRSRAENAIRFRNELALDPYIFTREGWTQHRTYLIYDGDPPISLEIDDEFLDDDS